MAANAGQLAVMGNGLNELVMRVVRLNTVPLSEGDYMTSTGCRTVQEVSVPIDSSNRQFQ